MSLIVLFNLIYIFLRSFLIIFFLIQMNLIVLFNLIDIFLRFFLIIFIYKEINKSLCNLLYYKLFPTSCISTSLVEILRYGWTEICSLFLKHLKISLKKYKNSHVSDAYNIALYSQHSPQFTIDISLIFLLLTV